MHFPIWKVGDGRARGQSAQRVPAAALAAGDIVAVLDLETYHGAGPKAWTVDQFAWSAEVPAIECESQFLRTIVKDCATGATVSVIDTTLDGELYEVTGDVGQCTPASGGGTPQPDQCQANTVIEARRCDDTDGDGVADTDYVELLAVDCDDTLTSSGTYTPDLSAPYDPVAPVPFRARRMVRRQPRVCRRIVSRLHPAGPGRLRRCRCSKLSR
ncbi:hypothetical protein ACFWOJ_04880 [Streptomyces sp. NPDC058439]|uniref:hypothetical protein n=1 Tax=Streptomyces sp. NPDC058439 TaxID=3346500 RepID=UPI003655E1BC